MAVNFPWFPVTANPGKSRLFGGEAGTLVGFIFLILLLFLWMDYRDISHEEITGAECRELNERWRNRYLNRFSFAKSLNVDTFDCPTRVSGLALGLRFLDQTSFAPETGEANVDFWTMLTELRPKIGENSGLQFAGRAGYAETRIDINPALLLKGDPVEIAGILVHEARHLQQGYNTHVKCIENPRLTCDTRLVENLKDGGAYSYSVLFYHLVLRHSDASAQDKRSAARLLDEVLKNRFNMVRPELLERYAL